MNNQKRTYLQMQFEEASLESGRYNTDHAAQNRQTEAAALLNAFRNTVFRLGSEFSLPSANNLDVANLRSSTKK